jgi:phage terminase large subunit GpA-like protein
MLIEAVAIDTGYNAEAVYAYCRAHAAAHVLAVKGASIGNKPVIGKPTSIDVTWRGKTMHRSLKLWPIGTDTAKHLIYGRLRLAQPGPGYIHLPAALKTTDEFEQLTAERLATKYIKGHPKLEWIKPAGKRNEALDCAVYAYAAACYLGIQTLREHGWARREDRYCPRSPDLFSHPAPKMEEKQAAPQQQAVTDSYKKRSDQPPAPPPAAPAAAGSTARPFSRDW